MIKSEKEALLNYLEFHLLSLCQQLEDNINIDAIDHMYKVAYDILTDLDESIEVNSPEKRQQR